MDLSHLRLSSTDNVRYVSENNLHLMLFSLKNEKDLKNYNNLKKKQFLIETFWLNL